MLIDTHCHLTFGELAPQTTAVLARARQADVRRVINVATSVPEARAGIELLTKHDNVWLVAGIHPHEAAKCTRDELDALAALHRGKWSKDFDIACLVGVGETGLDFHYDFASPGQQEEIFRFQLELALQVERPVVIHARQAEQRVCDILADYPQLAGRVVFHCYSGDVAMTRRVLDLGCWLSFTGVVTFKNAGVIRESARYAPGARIMVETDAPYLSPEPVRRTFPNEPALMVHTAKFLAESRGVAFDKFAEMTTANAIEFFNLPEERA
ncbi:MAG: TatD family hydrolase [Planctomycetota bacterium]